MDSNRDRMVSHSYHVSSRSLPADDRRSSTPTMMTPIGTHEAAKTAVGVQTKYQAQQSELGFADFGSLSMNTINQSINWIALADRNDSSSSPRRLHKDETTVEASLAPSDMRFVIGEELNSTLLVTLPHP